MKILALDSFSQVGSVALVDGDRVLAQQLVNLRGVHSDLLLRLVDQLLTQCELKLSDLHVIAAVQGPGSFTGLRTGLATVNGLAQAANLPLIGISSLQLLAANLPLCPVPICVFVDARKQEVYSGLYRWQNGLPRLQGVERVLPPAAALEGLPQKVALIGDGVALYSDLIQRTLGAGALLPLCCQHLPQAMVAATLAQEMLRQGAKTQTALHPSYIRPSDAELNAR